MTALASAATSFATFDDEGHVLSSPSICLGGVITQIACYFDYVENRANRVHGSLLLDLNHLVQAKHCFVLSRSQVQWLIDGRESVILPSPQVQFVEANRSRYLLPIANEDAPPSIPLSTYERQRGHSEAGPSTSAPPPSFEHQVLDSLGNLSLGVGQLASRVESMYVTQNQMFETQNRMYEDQIRGLYPLYDFAYRQGQISQSAQHPSWYTPPPPSDPHYGFQGPSFQGWAPGRGYGQDFCDPVHGSGMDAGTSFVAGRGNDDGNDGSGGNGDDDEIYREVDAYQPSDDDN